MKLCVVFHGCRICYSSTICFDQTSLECRSMPRWLSSSRVLKARTMHAERDTAPQLAHLPSSSLQVPCCWHDGEHFVGRAAIWVCKSVLLAMSDWHGHAYSRVWIQPNSFFYQLTFFRICGSPWGCMWPGTAPVQCTKHANPIERTITCADILSVPIIWAL